MLRDIVRPLRHRPGYVVLAVGMLSLGIAATTAIFSLVRGVLLTPPPFAEPERLVFVSTVQADDRNEPGMLTWPQQVWEEWFAETDSLESAAGYRWNFNYLVHDDGSEALEGMLVSEEYFSVVGIEPLMGRVFVDADSDGTQNPTIILGYELWKRRFEGRMDILGETVRLSRQPPSTVIGVMPPGVRFLPSPNIAAEPNYDLHARVDYWQPIPTVFRDNAAWNVVARLADGASVTEAEAELSVLLAQQADAVPQLTDLVAMLDPLVGLLNVEARRLLVPLSAAAALVLFIAAGNAVALLLMNGLRRQHEFGLRAAIGAGRRKLFGAVISESLLLAALSGVAGVLLSFGLLGVLRAVAAEAIPRLDDVTIGWPVPGFGVATAFVACIVAALIPAARAAALDPAAALRSGGPKSSGSRTERRVFAGVVIGQTAMTLALLVGAGLLIRTMLNLDMVQSGYDMRNILTMSVTSVDDDWRAFHERSLEEVSSLPGVEAAAYAWGVPLTGNAWPSRIDIDGYVPADGTDARVALPLRAVTGGYFEMLRQPLTVGRDFRISDDSEAPPVAIVNETFVAQYLGGGSAIGREIWTRGRENGEAAQIIGVVADSRTNDLTQVSEPEVYLPLWQAQAFSKHLVLRTTGSPEAIVPGVRAALRTVEPTVSVESIRTLEEIRGESLAGRTFAAQLLIGYAIVASILTLGGIYSVLSLQVASRRREIAIRAAVGANRGTILRGVLGQGMRIVLIGAVAGVAVSFALSSALQNWLFGVAPADPVTIIAAAGLFLLVGILACAVPSIRATRIEPAEALNSQ